MPDEATRGSALREKLKVAMAVAIAARRQVDRSSTTDWKEKALRARSSLMKVSRTLKASGNGSIAAIQAAVARIAECEQGMMRTQKAMAFPGATGVDDVRDKSNQLSSFVEAVGALNTVLDMRDGKLCRIWDLNPMKQLGNCLCDSLLGLPDSPMTDKALNSVCGGILLVAREGCSQHDIGLLCERLLQCALAAGHPCLTIHVQSRSLDGQPDQRRLTSMNRPRVPLVKAVLTKLAQNAPIGSVLLSQASQILEWLLGVANKGGTPNSMHAAGCCMTVIQLMQDLAAQVGLWLLATSTMDSAIPSRWLDCSTGTLARQTCPSKDNIHQEQVSHVIESLIDLSKNAPATLGLFPVLRDMV